MSGYAVSSTMPEKGWSILTVRTATAKKVKELARRGSVTVDEYINVLMGPTTRAEWTTCKLCGAKVKSTNLPDHTAKEVHPKPI
jgi:hypothetical protein